MTYITDPRQGKDPDPQMGYDEDEVIRELDYLCLAFSVEGYYTYVDDDQYQIEWDTKPARVFWSLSDFLEALVERSEA